MLEDYNEHDDIVKQIGYLIFANKFNVILNNTAINKKYTLPVETKYAKYECRTTDNIPIYTWTYITPENQIIIEIKAGCWRRFFDIKHPATLKLLLHKIEHSDFWDINEIMSKAPVTIKSFK